MSTKAGASIAYWIVEVCVVSLLLSVIVTGPVATLALLKLGSRSAVVPSGSRAITKRLKWPTVATATWWAKSTVVGSRTQPALIGFQWNT